MSVRVVNDIGVGIIQLAKSKLEVTTTAGSTPTSLKIPILRGKGNAFSSNIQVEITGTNLDLVKRNGIKLSESASLNPIFIKISETEITFDIDIHNVKTGGESMFKVKLVNVIGRDKLGGDIAETTIFVKHTLEPPGMIMDVNAILEGPVDARIKWIEPEIGGPVERYVVLAWREAEPEDRVELIYDKDQFDVVVEGLLYNQGYCIAIAAANHAGIGPLSETIHVKTLPELVLEYPRKRHFRTSERVGRIRITRNVERFDQTVCWTLTKKRNFSSQLSDVSATSSEESSEETDHLKEMNGTLLFSHGEHFTDAAFELNQAMRTSKQLNQFEMFLPATERRERQILGHIAVIIHNDTGRPGKIHNLTLESIGPNEVTVSWEPPSSGAPPTSYRIVCTASEDGSELILTIPAGEINMQKILSEVRDLDPEADYSLKIQAVNDIGRGKFSEPVKFRTTEEIILVNTRKTFKMSEKVAVIEFERMRCDKSYTYYYHLNRTDNDEKWQPSGELHYEIGDKKAELILDLSNKYIEDDQVFVSMMLVRPKKGKTRGSWELTIINDLLPGSVRFDKSLIEIEGQTFYKKENGRMFNVSNQKFINIDIIRVNGSDGPCTVHYSTESVKQKCGDFKTKKNTESLFKHKSGAIRFNDHEARKTIQVELKTAKSNNSTDKDLSIYQPQEFKVLLTKLDGWSSLQPEKSQCVIRIIPAKIPEIFSQNCIQISSAMKEAVIPLQTWLTRGLCYYTLWIDEEGNIQTLDELSGVVHEETELKLDLRKLDGKRGYCILNVEDPNSKLRLAQMKMLIVEDFGE